MKTLQPLESTSFTAIKPQSLRDRIERCLGALDQLDDFIVDELGTFSTPCDRPLEELREELDDLLEMLNEHSALTH